jgi:hypothetical protein
MRLNINLKRLPRRLYLPILAFATKFIFAMGHFPEELIFPLVYGLLFWFIISNIKKNGVWPYLVGLGTLSNFIVIALNGFKMPVWPSFLGAAGRLKVLEGISHGDYFGYILVGPDTKVPFLADVIGISYFDKLLGFASIGDILLIIGVAVIISRVFRT